MLLDRRSFSIGSAALLSGCTTVGGRPRTIAGCTPLPPVNVDERRVIRTVAGLRPYRKSGFVLRSEQLGEKRLVHNYGHGGGGITLSWGSSKLATELGLPNHSGPVAVIGAGVMGLSTARLVQEAGFPVSIYTAALPPDTTSNIAGGQFHPFSVFHPGDASPEFMGQYIRATEYGWRRFQIMVGDDYGIRWLPTYVAGDQLQEQLTPGLSAAQPAPVHRPAPVPAGFCRPVRHHVCRNRPVPSADGTRRSHGRRQDRGPQVRVAGGHRIID